MSAGDLSTPDLLLITFDALRYDVAEQAHREGQCPFLRSLLPGGWELRHAPGNFTYASHAALFAGFWPTPAEADGASHEERPFALRFHGSRSVGARTQVLDGETIVEGLRQRGYHTICIGGVGFFNRLNPLGNVFPRLFDESHWSPAFGVTQLHSTRAQVRQAAQSLQQTPTTRPLFLFLNVSATHAPTHFYLPGTTGESVASQRAALAYADRHLPELWEAFLNRDRPGRGFLMSDHGTLFGEEGRFGHRQAHPHVWNVPYAEVDWGGGGAA
ncbi:MAG: STM4013/SEN3800 family hydrolase [Planctomycetales bacterium]